jgi:SAM-dependent methyltransferase
MEKQLPQELHIERAQTQLGVNRTVLQYLYNHFDEQRPLQAIDLPCGNGEFARYLQQLFPQAVITACDLFPPPTNDKGITYHRTDLTEDLPFQKQEGQYDLVTSISGIMMFGNTLRFIKNCTRLLKPGGTFVITNDNNATIKDRLSYLFLNRFRIFDAVFEDDTAMTSNVGINEVIRLLRTNGMEVQDIQYTSLYRKDLVLLPVAWIIYAVQWLYLKRLRTRLPEQLKWKMYPFRHLLRRHYIIYAIKQQA